MFHKEKLVTTPYQRVLNLLSFLLFTGIIPLSCPDLVKRYRMKSLLTITSPEKQMLLEANLLY